jgi:BirA family biotin operon repressor/biotin-[acetyl-CoA-carboxylase] ligase
MLPSRLHERLDTRLFGRRLYYYPETKSTNTVALGLSRLGEKEGTVVVADFQIAGKGRLDHVWLSPFGKDLLFSVILQPKGAPESVLAITLAFSGAIAVALTELLAVHVGVKWPNDLVSGGGKIGGILAEGSSSATGNRLVVGTGINVNSNASDFPADIGPMVSSCRSLSGRMWDRADVFAVVLEAMESQYERFQREGFAVLRQQYERNLVLKGRRVSCQSGGESITGTVDGVNDDGSLRLVTDAGESRTLYSEELRLEQ